MTSPPPPFVSARHPPGRRAAYGLITPLALGHPDRRGADDGVAGVVRAGDGDGVGAPRALARALGAEPDLVGVDDLPVVRGVAVAEAVGRLVAGDAQRAVNAA